MNTPQSLPSQVRSVDFGFLNRNEIRSLSVQRITHTQAIDKELGFPIPGGLYDQALGTRGDYNCTTCDLESLCPGHAGHIQLPAPVYHPVFMDQLMKLLKGQCSACMKLRIGRVELHSLACKLKLLRYGLVNEAQQIDQVQVPRGSRKGEADENEDESDGDLDSGNDSKHLIIRLRNKFMKRAMKESGGKRELLANPSPKVESLVELRRELIKQFMSEITAVGKCSHCQAYSPTFRKDGFNKIFKQPLSGKRKMHNIQYEIRLVEPLLEKARMHQAAAAKRKKEEALHDDEGIAMEVDDISEEDMDDSVDTEAPHEPTDLLDSAAMVGASEKQKSDDNAEHQQFVTPAMILARMEELFREEGEILGLLYQSRPSKSSETSISPEMFFLFDVLVTPNKYRPDMRTGNGVITEAEQNKCYSDILNASFNYSDTRRSVQSAEQGTTQWARAVAGLQQSLIRMQDAVNTLIDSSKNPSARANTIGPEGIKQKLEKKEGLFRMNMMGKRVNFAARSVIAPSPDLETNEIGVPPVFAMKLTYPEPVTNHNYYEMKQAVLNGPDKWPGAAAIENETGQIVNLRYKNFEERQALANQLLAPSSTNANGSRNKKVHRHLNNGDMLIANRQPSLHKPSMMCHRARILKGEKTIRLHYANANTYNADFDGDEMNLHFPQSEAARAEAILIADTDHQFLSGTAGKPLRGLIQDHLSMSVWLCNKDTFFTREDYHQLLYSCLKPEETGKNILTVCPVILKPRPLWSGKQVITTLLENIKPPEYPGLTMTGKSNVPTDRWQDERNEVDKRQPGEGEVMFKDGELLCGILDKSQIGPSKGGFVHSIYEVYGHTVAGNLLSILGRMLTRLENMRAFSCGMEDIVFTKEGNKRRKELLKDSSKVGHEIATKYVSLEASVSRANPDLLGRLEGVLRDDKKQQGLDTLYNSRTKDLSSGITKGCLPFGLFKPFPRNQMQTMTISGAKGSGVNANLISCNLGQQVLEGRRTPTMVSGKTLPAFKPYETSIRAGGYITNRFLTGVQPQEYYFHTMAGREGLIDTAVKTSRSGYLQRCIIKGMEGLQVEYDTTVRDSDGSIVQFLYGEDGLDVAKQVQLQNFKFQAENFMSAAYKSKIFDMPVERYDEEASDRGQKAARKFAKTNNLAIVDPVTADKNPSSTWGSTSEKFAMGLKKYIKENPQRLIKEKKDRSKGKINKRDFQMLMEMMYQHAVIEPGEPVGIVAGQSIGEPSTQMTLNTFHLAGHSAKNVTLGIPRLRELIMTATASLATPQMRLYFNSDITRADGEKFAKGLSKRTVADAVDKIAVTERVGKGIYHDRAKMYDIRFDFFPAAEYRDAYAITEEDLASALELSFLFALEKGIDKEFKNKGLDGPEIGKAAGPSESEKTTSSAMEDAAEEGARKEKARTDDMASEESDNDDEPDEDKPDQCGRAYDEDEDDRQIADKAREGSVDPEDQAANPPHKDEGYAGSHSEQEGESESDDESESKERDKVSGAGAVSESMAKKRANRILEGKNHVSKFKWDTKKGAWCEMTLEYHISNEKILMLNLVEEASRKAVVQYIHAIESATVDTEKLRNDETGEEQDVSTLIVEGNNLVAMHDYQAVIDPHRIFTNDIVAMMKVYGVEAGRATLIREMNAVFEGHGIAVDHRHLNLIADHMTRNGDFLAFSRTGMKSGTSPFSKMSFETTVAFLRDAVTEADFDALKGPSARIVTGLPGKVGTGAFDVLTPLM